MSAPETQTEKPRHPHAKVLQLAKELTGIFAPATERIELAGGLRRGSIKVGDGDLVMLPKIVPAGVDLFEKDFGERNLQYELVEKLVKEGVLTLREPRCFGQWRQRVFYKDIPFDFWCAKSRDQWGLVMWLATGSAEFNKKCVTPRTEGGWKPADVRFEEGLIYVGGIPVPCPTEEIFFKLIEVPYRKPEDRYV